LDTIESQNTPFVCLPHSIPIGVAIFDCRTNLTDELWVQNGDFQVRVLLVSLESIQIFSHDHLYQVYGGLMLAYLFIEEDLETFAVMRTEGDGRRDIEVVKEVSNMKQNRVARLLWRSVSD
jgi:hypothetical protein